MRVSVVRPLFALLLFAACDHDDDTHDTWELVSFDGQAVPVQISEEYGEVVRDGRVVITEDSVIWHETVVFDQQTTAPDDVIELRRASAFEIEDGVVRSLPEAFDVPDDLFVACSVGGIYRVEAGGMQLRMIDVVTDGAGCGAPDPYLRAERVYRRGNLFGF